MPSTLILSTATNPGQASWSDSSAIINAVVGPVATSLTGDSQPLSLPETSLPLAGVTIPANTLVNGAAIDIQATISFDMTAAGAPVDVVLGLSISGFTTLSGLLRAFQLQPGLIYGGGILNICSVFTTVANEFFFTGMGFLDETGPGVPLSTTNGQTRLIKSITQIDPTQPCTIYPVVLPSVADPNVIVTAGEFAVVVRLP